MAKAVPRSATSCPHTAEVADDLCFIKTMHTEAINHGPGVTFMQTGSQVPGRPTIGSWLSYGLGSANHNLPSFVVLVTKKGGGQPLTSRYWDAGFLPAKHNGVQFRPDKDAVLYLNNPAGLSRANREATINTLRQLHELQLAQQKDPVIENHIAQYEMAFRMQASVPEATDVSDEPESVLKMYGNDVKEPGTYAANCLLARRLAERGVRFIQLYHRDWDAHAHLPNSIRHQARVTDQPSAALIKDLEAARPARRHPRHLGRGIRPHQLLPGQDDCRRLRPRSPPAVLHHVARGRRHQTRLHPRPDR